MSISGRRRSGHKDGDVLRELRLQIDIRGGEVDVAGVEDDVVVRVAHAWGGGEGGGQRRGKSAGGGRCRQKDLNRRGRRGAGRGGRTLSEELGGAEAVDLVHGDLRVHLLALVGHGAGCRRGARVQEK